MRYYKALGAISALVRAERTVDPHRTFGPNEPIRVATILVRAKRI